MRVLLLLAGCDPDRSDEEALHAARIAQDPGAVIEAYARVGDAYDLEEYDREHLGRALCARGVGAPDDSDAFADLRLGNALWGCEGPAAERLAALLRGSGRFPTRPFGLRTERTSSDESGEAPGP